MDRRLADPRVVALGQAQQVRLGGRVAERAEGPDRVDQRLGVAVRSSPRRAPCAVPAPRAGPEAAHGERQVAPHAGIVVAGLLEELDEVLGELRVLLRQVLLGAEGVGEGEGGLPALHVEEAAAGAHLGEVVPGRLPVRGDQPEDHEDRDADRHDRHGEHEELQHQERRRSAAPGPRSSGGSVPPFSSSLIGGR